MRVGERGGRGRELYELERGNLMIIHQINSRALIIFLTIIVINPLPPSSYHFSSLISNSSYLPPPSLQLPAFVAFHARRSAAPSHRFPLRRPTARICCRSVEPIGGSVGPRLVYRARCQKTRRTFVLRRFLWWGKILKKISLWKGLALTYVLFKSFLAPWCGPCQQVNFL